MSIRKSNKDRILLVGKRFVKKAQIGSNSLIESDVEPIETKYLNITNKSNCSIAVADDSSESYDPITDHGYTKRFVVTSSGVATGEFRLASKGYGFLVKDFAFDVLNMVGNNTAVGVITFYGYPILYRWSNGGPWEYNFGGSGSWHTVEDPNCICGNIAWNATTEMYDIRVAFGTPQYDDVVKSLTTDDVLQYMNSNLMLRLSVAPNGTTINTSGSKVAFTCTAIKYGAMTTELQFNSSYLNVKLGSTPLANRQWLDNGSYINVKYKNATYNTTYNFKKYIITKTKQDDSTDSEDSTSTTTYNTLKAETYKKYRYQVQYAFDTNYVDTQTETKTDEQRSTYNMNAYMSLPIDDYDTSLTFKFYMMLTNGSMPSAATATYTVTPAELRASGGKTWTINNIKVNAIQHTSTPYADWARRINIAVTPYHNTMMNAYNWIGKIEIVATKNATGDTVTF